MCYKEGCGKGTITVECLYVHYFLNSLTVIPISQTRKLRLQKLVTRLPEVAQLVRQLDHESRGSDSTPQAAPDEDIPRVNLAVRKRVFLLTCSQEAEPEGTGSLLLQSVARLVP